VSAAPRDARDFEAREDRLTVWLAHVLRAGVLVSAVVVVIGAGLYLARHGWDVLDDHVFHGEPAELRSVRAIVGQALRGHAESIIQLGLLLLIATPVARVVASAVGFARARDWLYVGMTAAVLALLAYSILRL